MADWHLRLRLNERFLNTTISAMETQRPSMFNYATERLAKRNGECDFVRDPQTGASRVTRVDPLVIGQDNRTRLLADYCYQIRNLKVDFSPLSDGGGEHFRLSADLFVGLGMPDKLDISDLLLPGYPLTPIKDNFIDYTTISCFRGRLEAAGGMEFVNHDGKWLLLMQISTFSLGAAEGIYAMLSHYARNTINAVILPQAAMALSPLEFEPPDQRPPQISLKLRPSPSPNPTFSSNALELRILTA